MAVIRPLVQRISSAPDGIHSPAEPIPDFPPPQMRSGTTVEISEQVDIVLFEGMPLFDATYGDITMSDASGPRRAWR